MIVLIDTCIIHIYTPLDLIYIGLYIYGFDKAFIYLISLDYPTIVMQSYYVRWEIFIAQGPISFKFWLMVLDISGINSL